MKMFNNLLISLVTAVLLSGSSCSEYQREIKSEQLQQHDDQLYYTGDEEKPYSGKVVELYESGQKRTELNFKDGKLHGMSTTWNSDGQKINEIYYQKGLPAGPYLKRYENGRRHEMGAYKNRKENGQFQFWYESGQLKRDCVYKGGILHGSCVSWYSNGQIAEEGFYKDGLEDGLWVFYYASGQKQKEGTYKDGKEEGRWIFWTRDGKKLEFGEVIDIDGNIYKTVKIGTQYWMAENLKVTHFRNGDPIREVPDNVTWANLTTAAYCNWANNENIVTEYGRLYNWYAVKDNRNIAPKGWHVPSDVDWQKLIDYLGGNSVAGGKMKEVVTASWSRWGIHQTDATNESGLSALLVTAHWSSSHTDATNESAFSALPMAGRDSQGNFYLLGDAANFWSSTESDNNFAHFQYLTDEDYVYLYTLSKQEGYSVRCVRD